MSNITSFSKLRFREGHLVRLLLVACMSGLPSRGFSQISQPVLGSRGVPVLTMDGLTFRDLNRDGKLEPFEDWRLTPEQRAADLVQRLTLEEKAGLMMHASAPAIGSPTSGVGREYDLSKTQPLIAERMVSTFITRLSGPADGLARQNNALQEQAEHTRFAIPLTISTDPRNNIHATLGASNEAGAFSQWPDMTGLGAIGNPSVTRNFADIARQEYLAVGIRMALSPQADLATEPRWPRIDGTFGEDPKAVKSMVEAYVAGIQGGETGLHPGSVISIVKHWAGYGAMKDGLDSHNSYSRIAAFSSDSFAQHLIPFEGAFTAKVGGVMPTYAILLGAAWKGRPLEQVAAGYSKVLLTDMLRGTYGFNGIVLTDWLITEDCKGECLNGAPVGVTPSITPGAFGMPWGVETLSPEERYAKAIDAGVDQFGGVNQPATIVNLVRAGKVSESRVTLSAKRILTQKFALGLFENPYVDPTLAASTVGRSDFKHAGLQAQEKSMVLLSNRETLLPVRAAKKVYLLHVDPAAARQAGLIPVATPQEAEFAVVRLDAPFQTLHPGYFFGSRQHEGDLDFKSDDPRFVEFQQVSRTVPTVAAIYLDRPAILTQIVASAAAVLVNFGANDEALFAIVTGAESPEGSLPFELPRSMNAVRSQRSDLPHDSVSPLFPMFYEGSFQTPGK